MPNTASQKPQRDEAQLYRNLTARLLAQVQNAKAIKRIYNLTEYIWRNEPVMEDKSHA